MGKATRLVRSRSVTGDGEGLVSHAGLVWLGEVADRSGLTAGLSEVLAEAPRRRHDRGVGLAQLVLALISVHVPCDRRDGGPGRETRTPHRLPLCCLLTATSHR
jgi:hypothetical protein